MQQLRNDILTAAGDRKAVFGEGNLRARVLLIGEAPGENEEKQGRPFVGKAGKNLNEFLALAGIPREEVFITNVVKIRPTAVSRAGRIVNRPPSKEEIALFLPLLLREIALVAPETIVTLGNVALKAVLGKDAVIGDCHGRLFGNVYPLYHPAAVIYNRSLKQIYEDDVRRLGAFLAHE